MISLPSDIPFSALACRVLAVLAQAPCFPNRPRTLPHTVLGEWCLQEHCVISRKIRFLHCSSELLESLVFALVEIEEGGIRDRFGNTCWAGPWDRSKRTPCPICLGSWAGQSGHHVRFERGLGLASTVSIPFHFTNLGKMCDGYP